MPKKDDICEIKAILGELSPMNSKNEQKVVAIASWNGKEDTINIRRYNVQDEVLLKGISLTPQEAEQLIYILIESGEINFDRERIRNALNEQEAAEVNIDKLVEELHDDDTDADITDEEAELYVAANGNNRARNGYMKIVPKNNIMRQLYGRKD